MKKWLFFMSWFFKSVFLFEIFSWQILTRGAKTNHNTWVQIQKTLKRCENLKKTKNAVHIILLIFFISSKWGFKILKYIIKLRNIRPNLGWSVYLQMQFLAVGLFSSFTLCSVDAIADIDCSRYEPTFGKLWIWSFRLSV